MPEKMLCIRKPAPEPGLELCEVPIPSVTDPDAVLIRVEATSICGTDVHIHKWDEWSANRIKPPLIVGHEFAGIVVEVGKEVHHVKVGDYVSAESHITCGMCFQCRTGQAHLCPRTVILGVDRPGVFAEYVCLPEKVVWHNDRTKLPPEVATLQEPFGNAVYAVYSHEISGHSAGVLGCGPIGLFSIAILKASGAAAIYATDVIDYRLRLAERMGATAVFNAGAAPPEESAQATVDWMVRANEGYGPDIVFEMSGGPAALTAAFGAVRHGGRVTLFGIPSRPVEIDVGESMIFKNLTVMAVNGRHIFGTWYRTRFLLESGVVDLRPLITHQMSFEQVDRAFELLASGEACKIVLRPPSFEAPPAGETSRPAKTDARLGGPVQHR
jgi:threonine 3-dehydrogenase